MINNRALTHLILILVSDFTVKLLIPSNSSILDLMSTKTEINEILEPWVMR